jgi:hypothetical protein
MDSNMPQSIADAFARGMSLRYPHNPGLVELVSQRIVSDGYCMTTLAATRTRDPSFADLVPPAVLKVQAHRDDACRILAAIVDGARTSKRPREPEPEAEAEPTGRELRFVLELVEHLRDPITLAPISAARVVSTGTTIGAVALREYRASTAGTPRHTLDPATNMEMMSPFFYPCYVVDNVTATIEKYYGNAPGDALKEIRTAPPPKAAGPAPHVLIESDDDETPLDADGWQRHHLLAPGASTSH